MTKDLSGFIIGEDDGKKVYLFTINEAIEIFGTNQYYPDTIDLKADGNDYVISMSDSDTFYIIALDGDENGSLTIIDSGRATAVRRGNGNGNAVRKDAGHGNAIRSGRGNGNAVRDGSGYGIAIRMDLGRGEVINKGKGIRAVYYSHLDNEIMKQHEKMVSS